MSCLLRTTARGKAVLGVSLICVLAGCAGRRDWQPAPASDREVTYAKLATMLGDEGVAIELRRQAFHRLLSCADSRVIPALMRAREDTRPFDPGSDLLPEGSAAAREAVTVGHACDRVLEGWFAATPAGVDPVVDAWRRPWTDRQGASPVAPRDDLRAPARSDFAAAGSR